MGNPLLPRFQVHAWSEEIGDHPLEHKTSIVRVVRKQRRLLSFVKQNGAGIQVGSPGLPERMIGFLGRIFDLAGGRLSSATFDQIAAAEKRVTDAVGELLPVDDALFERTRAVDWRAQPHLLDELGCSLLDPRLDAPYAADRAEALKLYLLLWVAVEVLDGNWKPPTSFMGDPVYRYVDLPPRAVES
jgi:hypothetical protein